jgi:sugar lactone lactonase YvrE
MASPETLPWRSVATEPSLLGESPFWHPAQQRLYHVDIPGRRLHCLDPRPGGEHRQWPLEAEPGSCAPFPDGSLMLAMRDGLWRFDPVTGHRRLLAPPPYDPATQRFNDGKCDHQGRFWVGALHDRREPEASLYRFSGPKGLQRMDGGVAVSNGLAWSPDGRTLYWSDTARHTIYAFDADPATGAIGGRRVFASFPVKQAGQDLSRYGGRPDGAAVDAEGCCWVAMFEGQRLLRLSPRGEVVRELTLPVRCPTMPCFGGADLKTLYVTTARHQRPAEELASQPLAGFVLAAEVDVPGLPADFCADFEIAPTR